MCGIFLKNLARTGALTFLLLLLVGCGTVRVPGISDIDKSQPSVTLSVYQGAFDTVDWMQGQAKAERQCRQFGYDDAFPLELSDVRCYSSNAYGCNGWQTTQKYVCREEAAMGEGQVWLGVRYGKHKSGVQILHVTENGPAERGGMRVSDVITLFDDSNVATIPDFERLLDQKKPGENIKMEIIRDGDRKTLDVELGGLN